MNFDSKEGGIAVHVGLPVLDLGVPMLPAANWIGTALLHRVFALALKRDGIEDSGGGGAAGVLNDSVYLVIVNNQDAAVETLKKELEPLGLLPVCQIAVRDGDSWRCVYPSPETRMGWLLDLERQEFAASQRACIMAEISRLARSRGGEKK